MIAYDTPIEVTENQYNTCMRTLSGIVAGRKCDGKFYIKLWVSKYSYLVERYLNESE